MGEVQIFLIEDNPADVVLTREALAGYGHPVEVVVANDGDQALSMLSNPSFHPDLIILDLNMPRMDGHSVLERHGQKHVPTVIFSSTQNDAEIQKALALGAREFIKKPLELEPYSAAVRGMVDRWVHWARREFAGTAAGPRPM